MSGSVSPGGPSSTDKRPRVVSSASMSGQENSNGLDALIHAASREKRLAISPYPEPISLDLSTPDALEPHVITALLTDDLLPIGAKQAGPDHTQLPETSYIRQISTVGSKPQVRAHTPPLEYSLTCPLVYHLHPKAEEYGQSSVTRHAAQLTFSRNTGYESTGARGLATP